jgi:hypothetical protein
LVWLALTNSGCGLADYEERLKENRSRIKSIEDEGKLLGDPIDPPPPKQDGPNPLAFAESKIFLCLPRAFKCKAPTKGPVSWGKYVQLFDFEGTESRSVLIAASTAETTDTAAFERDVWLAFTHYLATRLPKQFLAVVEPDQPKQVELQPLRLGKETPLPLKFTKWSYEEPKQAFVKKDPSPAASDKDGSKSPADKQACRYLIYFYHRDTLRVAIIYQVPAARADEAATINGIDASLKSLAVGFEGDLRRISLMRK